MPTSGAPRRGAHAARFLLLSAVQILVVACTYGEIVVLEPAAAGHGTLALTILSDPEDTAVAREVGWSTGIPGAEVIITAGGGDTAVGPPVATLVTDSAGRVSVPDLPDGKYFVQVRRLLTAAESARLAPTEDVVGFMTQTVVERGTATVSVPASRRRSIVISEWSFFGEGIPGLMGYDLGGYLELANNSDTTVYLDGLVVGSGYEQLAEGYPPHTCGALEAYTNDPGGIWAYQFDTLPGMGRTYPLAPGAVAMIATDAIDHSVTSPVEGLDLSHADFESIGTVDADNPAVPNTVSFGRAWFFDHGLYLSHTTDEVAFIALPVDTAALPKARTSLGREMWRVPRANMLDVMSIYWPEATLWSPGPLCAHMVSGNFERRPAPLVVTYVGSEPDAGRWSVQRKVAYIRSDGRKIVQHTRTTDADFILRLRTPFQLP